MFVLDQHFALSRWIADDNLAPSTEYREEIATVTQFLSEMRLELFFLNVLMVHNLFLQINQRSVCRRQAHLCVLAANCDEPMYVKLVEALCAEHQINLIKVDDNKKLGEWVGLCKIDREGKPRKVVGCSCVVVKDYGKESQAKDVIEEYFKAKK
uniref:Ribosomal protein S12 n=1 Tax=Seriola lalandi dorsalis TaxID=1841481 RepID=A0A3B4W9R9_SERLL